MKITDTNRKPHYEGSEITETNGIDETRPGQVVPTGFEAQGLRLVLFGWLRTEELRLRLVLLEGFIDLQ
jgi:hypothetical protein